MDSKEIHDAGITADSQTVGPDATQPVAPIAPLPIMAMAQDRRASTPSANGI